MPILWLISSLPTILVCGTSIMTAPKVSKEKNVTYHTQDPALRYEVSREIMERTRDAAQLSILLGVPKEEAMKTLAISMLEGTGTPHGVNRKNEETISKEKTGDYAREFLKAKLPSVSLDSLPLVQEKSRILLSSLPLDIQQQLIYMDKMNMDKVDPIAKYRGKGDGKKYSEAVSRVLYNAQDIFSNYEFRNLVNSLKTKEELFASPIVRTPALDLLQK